MPLTSLIRVSILVLLTAQFSACGDGGSENEKQGDNEPKIIDCELGKSKLGSCNL